MIITNEFEGLPDKYTKRLFVIVGLATIARVGISTAMAKEAYQEFSQRRTFDEALNALEGIVIETEGGRLYARHELYVRHVLENIIDFSEISASIISILKTFIKFDIPVVKTVKRTDSVLFRSIINHHFIAQHAKKHGKILSGLEVYESFEVDFQLDGHYWLQYGLYLANLPRLTDAGRMLSRSIEAYPANMFAVHALADIELRIAKDRTTYDSTTMHLIDKAVTTLLIQDSKSVLEIDQYPIVTLTNGHVSALIKHHQNADAKKFARQYFERIQSMEKQGVASASIGKAKDRLFRFITLNEWQERGSRQEIRPKRGRRRGKRTDK